MGKGGFGHGFCLVSCQSGNHFLAAWIHENTWHILPYTSWLLSLPAATSHVIFPTRQGGEKHNEPEILKPIISTQSIHPSFILPEVEWAEAS